jgi:uncharacterized protein (UPF0332 family)
MTTQRDADDYLAKALESLASAEADLAAGRYNSSMNRCYFACFQAAVSVLVKEGIVSGRVRHPHHFVQASFTTRLIERRKLLPQRLAEVLQDLIVLRHQADYRVSGISRTKATQSVSRARDFVETIRARTQVGS